MYSERRGARDRPPREMHKVVCQECGQETEVPFEPDGTRPVYCKECFQKKNPRRGEGRPHRGGRMGGRDRPPREMHKVVCQECGQETEVPFEPDGTKPVYCKECFQKKNPRRF